MLKEEVMPRKVVIKIKARDGAHDFSAPLNFRLADCYCLAMPLDRVPGKIRAVGSKPVREVLDGLEQMYEDLYGDE